MRRVRLRQLGVAIASVLAAGSVATPGGVVAGMPEADRLWVVGARAFDDGLYDVTYRELGRFTDLAPTDSRRGDAEFLRGKAAYAMGRYPEALAEFQASERYPLQAVTPGEPIFWQAETLFRLKHVEQASARYALFLQDFPRSPYAPDALYSKGFAELELGRGDDAISSFARLLQEHPRSERAGPASYTLARELVQQKRWAEALPYLAAFPARYPGSPYLGEVRYLLGLTQIETGRTGDGLRNLEQYIATDPRSDVVPTARLLVAEAQQKAGRPLAALDQYQTLVRTAPSHPLVPQVLYQIGDLAVRVGRPADAEAAWVRLRRDFPRDPGAGPAGLGLAGLYLKRRQVDAAREVARSVADERGAERVPALLLLGESALQARRLDDAEQAYTRAVAEADPDSSDRFRALAGVALVAEMQKAPATARDAYQQIAFGASDPELVRWAKGRMLALESREAAVKDTGSARDPSTSRDDSSTREIPRPRAKPKPPLRSGGRS